MLILSYTIYKVIFCTKLCTTAAFLNVDVLCAFCLSEPSVDTLENNLNPDQAQKTIKPDHDPNCHFIFERTF